MAFMDTYGSDAAFSLPGMQNDGGGGGVDIGRYGNALPGTPDPLGGLGTQWSEMGAYGKMATVGKGVGAFASLANIYAGFKAMKLAKSQFKFQKDAWNKNYQAQVKDYENTLKDRWTANTASAAARGQDYQSMSSYVDPRAIDSGSI